jgi:cytosine/adenosine deaminase-related metal-dependent hydrolase
MLYTHATIITVNPSREIILDGAILVQGNLIAALDKTDVLTKMHPAEEIVDLEGHIIIPGLISTHMHTAQTLLRGELCLKLMAVLLFVATSYW